MNPTNPRYLLDLMAARYLEALEHADFATMGVIWERAYRDHDLEATLHELHDSLLEEQGQAATAALTKAIETHLPSAEIARPADWPVLVADVAQEVFRHTPDRLTAAAHLLNERLRTIRDPVPAELGLAKLTAWAEARFGAAPADYWKAFRQAAIKLQLRRAAEITYQLAARPAPEPEDKR